MAKLIDPDNNSVSMFSFIGKFYKDEKDVAIEFRGWKRASNSTRKIILDARNRFSAHTDSQSFHQNKNFGLCLEDVDQFLLRTINFLDFLYEKDAILKSSFDKQVCPALPGGENPSDTAKSWKIIMATRIKYLRDNNKNKGINFSLKH